MDSELVTQLSLCHCISNIILIFSSFMTIVVTCLNSDPRCTRIFLCQLQVHVTNWLVPLRPTCVHRSTITGAGTAGDVETAGDVVDIPQQRIPYTVDAHRTRIFGSITSVHHHPRRHPAFITT